MGGWNDKQNVQGLQREKSPLFCLFRGHFLQEVLLALQSGLGQLSSEG